MKMKKLWYSLMWPIWLLLLIAGGTACSTDEVTEPTGEYGYVQFYITKAKLKSNVVLDSLADARQVEVLFSFKNQDILQTIPLKGDEAYLTSEKLSLLVGDYVVKQYKIYDGSGKVLQTGEPSTSSLKVEKNVISNFAMSVNAVLRGKVGFVISKDYSLLKSTSEVVNKPIELYQSATQMNITLQDPMGAIVNLSRLKLKMKGDLQLLATDTLVTLVAGKYKCLNYTLLDYDGKTLAYEVPESRFVQVEDFTQKVDTLPIQLARTAAIEDYYALKAIWDKMDGANWGWQILEVYPAGTNWNFNKPVDAWGKQPGVYLGATGRVKAINLGAFNPKGAIPEELGQLAELEALWLGASSDRAAASYSATYSKPNTQERFDAYRNWLTRYYHTSTKYAANFSLRDKMDGKTYEIATYRDEFAPMNGITALPKSIGNLKKLTALFIGNNHISTLPDEIAQCEGLTDLVLYNLPLKEFPAVIGKLPNLAALGASFCDLNNANSDQGLKALCNGPAGKELQLLFLDNNYFETLPAEFNKLTNIGLFDLSYNQLKTLPSMGNAVMPVILLASNNRIASLPDDLCNLIDIETFDVSYNQIRNVPRIFNASSLTAATAVLLNDNLIEEIPDDFPGFRTEELYLSNNRLTTLSKAIIKSEIFNLVVRNNRIETLPMEIGDMRTLIALDLEGNRIQELPRSINVLNMPILKGLSLNFNRLSYVSSYLFYMTNLGTLMISSQFDENGKRTLKELPSDLVKAYGLRVLIASGNDLRSFPTMPYMLNYLDVSDNPNIQLEIPYYICERIAEKTFKLVADEDQIITGCGL